MKKLIIGFVLSFAFFSFATAQVQTTDANIDEITLEEIDVPAGTQDIDFEGIIPPARKYIEDENGNIIQDPNYDAELSGKLGKKIENGTIALSDIPIFIVKTIDLVSKLAGSITVLMLMYAGIQYMLGVLTEDKEKAKTTIKYALIGLVVTFISWLVVNIIKTQLTGVDYFGNFVEEQQ